MTGRAFTVGEIAAGAFGGDENRARLALWPVTSPPIQTGVTDPDETVDEAALWALLALHPKRNPIHKGVSRFLAQQASEERAE